MKTSRSDWAASTPWAGITNKPSTFNGGITDIGQLTGTGFTNGKIPSWNSTLRKFVPATNGATTPSPPVVVPAGYLQTEFYWDAPSLLPLQSVYEDFPFIGALPGSPVAVGVSFDLQFCQPFASVITNNSIRLMLVNMNVATVDLASGVWKLRIFQ